MKHIVLTILLVLFAANLSACRKNAGAKPSVVSGLIVQTSRIPDPLATPYKDCLALAVFRIERVESGAAIGTDVIAAFPVMLDHKLLPAASHVKGDRLCLTLVPFDIVGRQIANMQRSDDISNYDLDVYYVAEEKKLR